MKGLELGDKVILNVNKYYGVDYNISTWYIYPILSSNQIKCDVVTNIDKVSCEHYLPGIPKVCELYMPPDGGTRIPLTSVYTRTKVSISGCTFSFPPDHLILIEKGERNE